MDSTNPNNKLFVGSLAFSATEEDLKVAFEKYGVKSVFIPTDRMTGRARGFAFVELESAEMAAKAIEEMNGVEIAGRPVALNLAQPRPERQ